jgi:hypothetical protein
VFNPLFPPQVLTTAINNLITSSGYTQTQCDLNSVVSTWYIDCRLESDILIQAPFFTGYGNDTPTYLEISNAIDTELDTLYEYGLNYFKNGTKVIISNTTCYDNFTDKIFYLNIGVDIQINCTN